jgi:glycosyltransferase involved in cell wall biosynthesis
MRVNIFVEDLLFFRFIGCASVAHTLFSQLSRLRDLDVSFNAHGQDFDLVHYHTFGPLSLLNRKYSDGVKILTAHSTPRVNVGNLAFSNRINSYYPKIYRKFDHIVTISRPCQREIEKLVPDIPTTLIPNGVDREFFRHDPGRRAAFRKRYGIGEDEQVVLTVAQQTPRKGIYDFIELTRTCPDVRWVWVGGFPYGMLSKDYIRIEQVKRQCGTNVIFTGIIPDILEAYSAADVFFMPSYAETFGLAILEALSCGLPVVARGIPEFREIFSDGVLFFTTTALAEDHFNDFPALRRSAVRARDFSAQFDSATIARRHCALYRKLIEK